MRPPWILIAVAVLVAAFSDAAAQESESVPKVGWIAVGVPAPAPAFDAFKEGLRQLGYIDGRTVAIEARWAEGVQGRVPDLARELIGLKVDVIVTQGPAIQGTRPVAGDTPVVFGFSGDPVVAGLVGSLAHPGGNLTGVSFMSYELNEKRLGLLREALPQVSRVALLSNPNHPGEHLEVRVSARAAQTLGLALHTARVLTATELMSAFQDIRRTQSQAIVVLPDAFFGLHLPSIIDFATREGIPVISGWASYAAAGALFTYGPNLDDSFRRLAYYVDRIVKGAKPVNLPVERPTKFELVVNLRTAKALGITVPQSILIRADEVIE